MCTADGLCRITSSSAEGVTCTSGLTCDIHCTGSADACNGGVDCLEADGCFIECAEASACRDGGVQCGGAFCDLRCDGDNACRAGVTCSAACCRLDCRGNNACRDGEVSCAGSSSCLIQCRNGDNACLDVGAACDSGTCQLNLCSLTNTPPWDCTGVSCHMTNVCEADPSCPM
jgi:hypothetical protein